jgi:proteasome component ECM29
VLEVWDEIWTDGTPGTESGIRLYLKEIVALLTVALESQQWKMKAQAARAMGAIGTKLKSSMPDKEQGMLLTRLVDALSGRTWSGKESILQAIAELICCNTETSLKMLENPAEPLTKELLMTCLLRESSKQMLEYKIAALGATSKILRGLDLDYFKPLYEMLLPFVRKSMDEETEKQNQQQNNDADQDKTSTPQIITKSSNKSEEVETYSLDLQLATVECLGQAWPENPETQIEYIEELLTVLNAMVQNTTRKLQVAIAKSMGQIMASYGNNCKTDEVVFTKVSNLLAYVLSMPKNSQLRTEALDVLEQVIVLLDKTQPVIIEAFQSQVGKSLDDVIKDLGTDAAIKDKARSLKKRLVSMNKMEM